MSKASRKSRRRVGRPRARRLVTVPQLDWNGDHGTGTAAATAGTVMEAVAPPSENPNRMGRRKRINRVEWLMERGYIDMRQFGAATKLQEAFGRVEMLSSGGELKERVQTQPKPDAVVAAQVEAISRLGALKSPIHRSELPVVEHVVFHNQPITSLEGHPRIRSAHRLRSALDRLAQYLEQKPLPRL